MADKGTFELIATHLALAMRPLKDAVADVDSFKRFMYPLGWEVDDLPAPYTALATHVETLLAAVEALGDSPTIDQIEALLGDIKTLVNAIKAITVAPAGVDPTEFLADIGERLFEVLLVDYLIVALPFLARTLELLDVITFTRHPETATRPDYTETRFRFAEIPKVIADPLSIPTRVYGWGTADLDFTLITTHLLEVLLALGLQAAVRRPLPARGAAYQVDRSLTLKGIDRELVLSLFEFSLAGKLEEIGLALLEFPGEGTNFPGLILQPVLPSNITTNVDVRPDLKLAFRAGSDLAQTFGIFVRPGEIGVRYPFQPGTVPPSAGFAADLTYKPDQPSLLLGTASGSRLQLVGITSGLHLDFVGTDADVEISLNMEGLSAVLSLGDQDSFLGSLFGGNDLTIAIPLGVRWSNQRGFSFTGGAGFEITVAPHVTLGPITLDTVHLAVLATLSSDAPPAITAGADVGFHGALGPIAFSVEGIGVTLAATFESGNAGPFDVATGFKAPTGLGLVVDSGVVTGGGFLSLDRPNGRYAGILQLRVAEIGITAIGLLDTKLPGGQSGYSFLIIVAATFQPIQLGFGFTLNGVGGLAGIHRTMVVDAIQSGLRNHAIDHILFPQDPIANATQIISDLRTIFPPMQGRFVFGPMALIGWGTPTLITLELGILLELPAPVRLVLLGQLSMTLPNKDAALVEIHIDILGILDFEARRISVDAILHDSRIALFNLSGAMAFRFSWGDDPVFVLSIGGVNPHFQPPAGFPALEPLTVSLGLDDNPRISLKGYLAFTSNTLQVGALAELYAEAGGFNLYGWIGFDALFVFLPFSFVTDFSGGVKLRRGSSNIAGVHLEATLSGISPWHAKGRACVSLWLFDVCVHFDKPFGSISDIIPPLLDPEPELLAAIADARNWSTSLPSATWRAVSVKTPGPDDQHVLIDPVGGVVLRERVLPLNRRFTKFGEATPSGPGRYDVTAVTLGGSVASYVTVQDHFAQSQFEQLTDAQKLSLPSFTKMDAGVDIASDSITAGPGLGTDLVYETRIVDAPWSVRHAPPYPFPIRNQNIMVAAGAAGRSPFRSRGAEKFMPAGVSDAGTMVSVSAEPYVIAGIDDLATRANFGIDLTKADAFSALEHHFELHPEDRGSLQVVPRAEAVASG
ncbi:MAG: DUF6603 domain-containing protein [bacterium]